MRLVVFIISILLLVYMSLHEVNYLSFRGKKKWYIDDTLTYSDFQALRKPYYIPPSIQELIDTAKINNFGWIKVDIELSKEDTGISDTKIIAVMDPKYSYLKNPSRSLLRHEQYHFNLAELSARILRKQLIENLSHLNSTIIDSLHNQIMIALDGSNDYYDSITQHGLNAGAQGMFEEEVDNWLDSYELFQNPLLSSYKNEEPIHDFQFFFQKSISELQLLTVNKIESNNRFKSLLRQPPQLIDSIAKKRDYLFDLIGNHIDNLVTITGGINEMGDFVNPFDVARVQLYFFTGERHGKAISDEISNYYKLFGEDKEVEEILLYSANSRAIWRYNPELKELPFDEFFFKKTNTMEAIQALNMLRLRIVMAEEHYLINMLLTQ